MPFFLTDSLTEEMPLEVHSDSSVLRNTNPVSSRW